MARMLQERKMRTARDRAAGTLTMSEKIKPHHLDRKSSIRRPFMHRARAMTVF
jgi:hypothetical protein